MNGISNFSHYSSSTDELYSPITLNPPKISSKDVIMLDSRRDPPEGRWHGEQIDRARDLIKRKILRHNARGVVFDSYYEKVFEGYNRMVYALDEWVEHDIDPYVEYYGYIYDLEVFCFKINIERDRLDYALRRERFLEFKKEYYGS